MMGLSPTLIGWAPMPSSTGRLLLPRFAYPVHHFPKVNRPQEGRKPLQKLAEGLPFVPRLSNVFQ